MNRLMNEDGTLTDAGKNLSQNLERNFEMVAQKYVGYDPVDFFRIMKQEVLALSMGIMTANDYARYNAEEKWCL